MQANIFDETENLSHELKTVIEQTALETALHFGLCPGFSVDITIMDKESIREINASKRKIDKATDVLSFPMVKGSVDVNKPQFLGDILICLDILISQALEYGHSELREAGFLTAHGMLHLLGYDHMTLEEEDIMFKKQEEILGSIGLMR